MICLPRNRRIGTVPGMFLERNRASATCTSAGRVTAKLLLSFLALSPSPISAAGQAGPDAQLVLPIDSPPIAPLIPEHPTPAEHTFVSGPHDVVDWICLWC